MPLPLLETFRARILELCTGAEPEEMTEILTGFLQSDDACTVAAAAFLVGEAPAEIAAPLIDPLLDLLTSALYVPCDQIGPNAVSHEYIAEVASRMLLKLRLPLPAERLTALLDQPGRFIGLRAACFDQGAYIGDYQIYNIYPAAQAARLAALAAPDAAAAFALAPKMIPLLAIDSQLQRDAVYAGIKELVKLAKADANATSAAVAPLIEALGQGPQDPPWVRSILLTYLAEIRAAAKKLS